MDNKNCEFALGISMSCLSFAGGFSESESPAAHAEAETQSAEKEKHPHVRALDPFGRLLSNLIKNCQLPSEGISGPWQLICLTT